MTPRPANHVILEVFDRARWCPVFQARFVVAEFDALRTVLGIDDDPDLRHVYTLDRDKVEAVVAAFDVAFDPDELWSTDVDIKLARQRSIQTAPYLIHTGYELPLLLDGRKKLARMSDSYPPMAFDGEDRFDHWVATGVLHIAMPFRFLHQGSPRRGVCR